VFSRSLNISTRFCCSEDEVLPSSLFSMTRIYDNLQNQSYIMMINKFVKNTMPRKTIATAEIDATMVLYCYPSLFVLQNDHDS